MNMVIAALLAAQLSFGPEIPLAPPSARGQTDVRIVGSGSSVVAAWVDGGTDVVASINGRLVTVVAGDATVWAVEPAVGARAVLVVWRRDDLHGDNRLLARRFDLNGNALDAQTLTLALNSDDLFYRPRFITAVFDGASFLVAWTATKSTVAYPPEFPGTLNSIRIGESGEPFGARQSSAVWPPWSLAHAPRLLWTGSDFVLSYWLQGFSALQPVYDPSPAIVVTRYSGINASEIPVGPSFDPVALFSGHVASTLGPHNVTLAWFGDGMRVAQTTLAGAPLRAPRLLVPWSNADVYPSIAWDGTEYLLVWSERPFERSTACVRAMRLDQNLDPIDAQPVVIAPDLGESVVPQVVRTAEGWVVGYSRAEVSGGPQRAFVRVMVLPETPRRRVVRR